MHIEREVLAASLPPDDASGWAEFTAALRRKQAACPPAARLIRLVQGLAAPDLAQQLHQHLRTCEYCRSCVESYRAALAGGSPGEPAPVPAIEAAPEVVVTSAGDAASPACSSPPPVGLLDLLRAKNSCLRRLTVLPGWHSSATEHMTPHTWDRRIADFGLEAGPLLVSLLAEATHVGVAWGHMVAAAVDGVKEACKSAPARRGNPVVCVATAGGLVGELKVSRVSSSSLLASGLAEALNGNWERLYTLHGVEAFISFLDSGDEVGIIKKRISRFPNYRAIFGGDGQPGAVHKLDAIVTSCGTTQLKVNQFWTQELRRLGVPAKTLDRLTYGDIGGVFLPREDLRAGDEALFDDLARRWTGITLEHYRQCARRSPGVILVTLGRTKAAVVVECIRFGLVTELIIDEELAAALWDIVDPKCLHHPSSAAAPAASLSLKQ